MFYIYPSAMPCATDVHLPWTRLFTCFYTNQRDEMTSFGNQQPATDAINRGGLVLNLDHSGYIPNAYRLFSSNRHLTDILKLKPDVTYAMLVDNAKRGHVMWAGKTWCMCDNPGSILTPATLRELSGIITLLHGTLISSWHYQI